MAPVTWFAFLTCARFWVTVMTVRVRTGDGTIRTVKSGLRTTYDISDLIFKGDGKIQNAKILEIPLSDVSVSIDNI